jgi:hypothetical protein
MNGRSKRKLSFLELEALPPDLRDFSLYCHPRSLPFNRQGGVMPAPIWSGPRVSAQGASLQSLILCSGQHQYRGEISLESL